MKDDLVRYLDSLDLPTPTRARVEEVAAAFELLSGRPLDRLFLSDALDETNGERSFESVWAFAGPFWLEARDFTRQFDLDISPYFGSVLYLGVRYEGMRLGDPATEKSRVRLEIETAKVRYSQLFATGKNCDSLLAIMNELLLPNLKLSPDGDAREGRAS